MAAGCLAERYGAELADALPEADAVLGFDSYADIAARLDDVARRRPVAAAHAARPPHAAADQRRSHRPAAAAAAGRRCPAMRGCRAAACPHAGSTTARSGTLKLASGCDRRCTFCAIPSFRGSFVSRPPAEVLAEARWLAAHGVRELVLVSENSTSYGKDLGDLHALETLLPQLAAVDGIERVRVSYLQPAELRPSLLEAIADDARRRAVLRPVLPARQPRRCCGG